MDERPPWCPWCAHHAARHDPFGCRHRSCKCEHVPPDVATPPPVGPPRRRGLTARECDVVTHLAAGLTLAQIGQVLGICEPTVKSISARARAKLGGRNTAHAVALAYEAGLLGQRGGGCGG